MSVICTMLKDVKRHLSCLRMYSAYRRKLVKNYLIDVKEAQESVIPTGLPNNNFNGVQRRCQNYHNELHLILGKKILGKKPGVGLDFKINCRQNYQLRWITTTQWKRVDRPVTQHDVFFFNLARLEDLIEIGKIVLADAIFDKLSAMHNLKRENDCYSSETRIKFLNGPGQELYKNAEPGVKKHLEDQSFTWWRVSDQLQAAKCLNVELSYQIFEKFETLSNKVEAVVADTYAYDPLSLIHNLISDKDCMDLFKRISTLYFEMNIPSEKIDIYKPHSLKHVKLSARQQKYDVHIKEVIDLGNGALRERKFRKAIKLYTKAILNSAGLDTSAGVPSQVLGELYLNRSIAHERVNNVLFAVKDAEYAKYFTNLKFKQYKSESPRTFKRLIDI